MRNGYRITTIALLLAISAAGQTSEPETPVDPEIERLQSLVDAGVIPPAQLARAREEANRSRLEVLVRGLLQQQNLPLDQVTTLLRSVVDLQKIEYDALRRQQALIAAGAAPANTLKPFRDQVDYVDKQFELASTRARLVQERASMVSAEDHLDELIDEELAIWSEGDPGQWDDDILEIDAFYFEEFGVGLPISAAGATDLHVSMGFDHTGRYDVALHPDEFEGQFLMSLLEEWDIPYIAFRSAVPGQATGPHIHIGPPSLRIDPQVAAEELDELLDELLGDEPTGPAPE